MCPASAPISLNESKKLASAVATSMAAPMSPFSRVCHSASVKSVLLAMSASSFNLRGGHKQLILGSIKVLSNDQVLTGRHDTDHHAARLFRTRSRPLARIGRYH